MQKRIAFALALIFALTPLHAHAAGSSTRAVHEAARAMERAGFSGAVLVARADRILLSEGYGAIRGQRMRQNSRFWISSMGKQFISAGIMRCVDMGRLRLDQSLSEVWPDTPEDKRSITIRQVLSHTSGLPQSYDFEAAQNGEAARDSVFALSLEAAPGAGFIYSNANYALAAAIIERACGANHADFVREEIMGPARLRNTGQYPRDRSPHVVGLMGETTPAHSRLHWWQAYYSTTHDLYRWRQALWSDRVISASSREAMLTPVATIQEGQAALGWFMGRTERGSLKTFVRGNDDTGQNSLLYYYPETDTTIIVLSHAGDRDDETSWSRAMLAGLEMALAL